VQLTFTNQHFMHVRSQEKLNIDGRKIRPASDLRHDVRYK